MLAVFSALFFGLNAVATAQSSNPSGAARPQQSPVVPPRRYVRQGRLPTDSISDASPESAAAMDGKGAPRSSSIGAMPEAAAFGDLWWLRWEVFALISFAYSIRLLRKYQVMATWARALLAEDSSSVETQDTVTMVLEVSNLNFKQLACHTAAHAAVKRAVEDIIKQVPLLPFAAVDVQLYEELHCNTHVQVVAHTTTGLGEEVKAALGLYRLCEGVAAAVYRVENISQLLVGQVVCNIVHGPELTQAGVARCC